MDNQLFPTRTSLVPRLAGLSNEQKLFRISWHAENASGETSLHSRFAIAADLYEACAIFYRSLGDKECFTLSPDQVRADEPFCTREDEQLFGLRIEESDLEPLLVGLDVPAFPALLLVGKTDHEISVMIQEKQQKAIEELLLPPATEADREIASVWISAAL